MSLWGGSGRNWPTLGPRLSCAVRAMSQLVTRRPRRFCFRGMPGLLIALRFRVASHRRASSGRLLPLLTGPDRPPAFCKRDRRLPFDEPDDQLTPRQSGDDPGIRPVEPVLWPGRVWAGMSSSPGGPRSGPRRTGRQYPVTGCTPVSVPSPRQFHDWLTGSQCTCTARRLSQQRLSSPGGSQALSTPRWRWLAGSASRRQRDLAMLHGGEGGPAKASKAQRNFGVRA
jgi:hypothetical protein